MKYYDIVSVSFNIEGKELEDIRKQIRDVLRKEGERIGCCLYKVNLDENLKQKLKALADKYPNKCSFTFIETEGIKKYSCALDFA